MAQEYSAGTELACLPNGWTLNSVPAEDVALEGHLMGNCLWTGDHCTPGRLLSLRDTEGVPRVTVELFEGRVMRAEARYCETPTAEQRAMLESVFPAAGLGRFVLARGGHWGRGLVW